MKKHLLTSTAIVAAGAFAFAGSAMAQTGKPTLTLGGWAEQIFGFSDNDNPSSYGGGGNGWDVQSDSEIHFNSSVTLDNGIKITARIELEGNTSTDQIDENWLSVSGSFGTVRLGSTDEAAKAMTTGYMGSWSAGVGQNMSFDVGDWIELPSQGAGAANNHAAGTITRITTGPDDSESISYFTPRFAGFQVGASYTPGGGQDTNNTPASSATDDHDGMSIAVNFDRKFGDVGLGAAIGYSQMKDALGGGADENTSWGGALRVDFAGFRVAAGYIEREDAAGIAGSTTEGTHWNAGIRYTFGLNAVSLTYQNTENERSVNGPEDELQQAMISYNRTLAPGVNWTLNGMWADYDGGRVGPQFDNDGYALTSSIKLSF